jgi:methylenetetrahydrofolate reductase (NADPH)
MCIWTTAITEHPALSFEVFPPKTDEGLVALGRVIEELVAFKPGLITCTYGAGGSTRSRTLQTIELIRSKFAGAIATHLTCVGSTVEELAAYLDKAIDTGASYVVALRGDPPKGETSFHSVEGGLCYANELVSFIRSHFSNLQIVVAGYPEVHQEAPDARTDLDNLKRKVDAGAAAVITQLFFDNDCFFRFRDACDGAGIRIPIIPGIMPASNLSQIQRITSMCAASLPAELLSQLSAQETEAGQQQVGIDHATAQVEALLKAGVQGIHFYVLNRSEPTAAILQSTFINHGCDG